LKNALACPAVSDKEERSRGLLLLDQGIIDSALTLKR
jgi:hypothetical protein